MICHDVARCILTHFSTCAHVKHILETLHKVMKPFLNLHKIKCVFTNCKYLRDDFKHHIDTQQCNKTMGHSRLRGHFFYPETEEKYAFLEPPTSFYPCSGTFIYYGDHALKLQNISVFSLCNIMSQILNSITGYTQLN